MAEIQSFGKINIRILEKEYGEIQTDEIIVTSERINHIKERHPEDYYLFEQYGEESVGDPDIIRLPCGACVDQDHEAMLHGLFFGDSGADCY